MIYLSNSDIYESMNLSNSQIFQWSIYLIVSNGDIYESMNLSNSQIYQWSIYLIVTSMNLWIYLIVKSFNDLSMK